jgi:hypothetical protein
MNKSVVRATALFVMASWSWMWLPQASAQLGGQLIVNITSPANGSTVSGTVPVTASVTIIGALTVRDVQFKLDGANLGSADSSAPYSVAWNTTTASNGSHTLTAVATAVLLGLQFTSNPVTNLGTEDTAAPYAVSWNTTTTSDGSHTLTAVARDAAGNSTTSAAVMVTVSNAPPPDTMPPSVSLTAPANGATVSNTITVSANASDNVGVVGVQFKLDGANLGTEDSSAPYAISWDTTSASNGSHTLTAVARDAAGNSTTSAGITITVSNGAPPDTTPPTVSLTEPANGATVSGIINVSANASDNVGVAGVQFKLDGVNLNAEDTSSPYTTSWNTTATSNGSHTLTAVARDAAGNSSTSAAVTVTVSNSTSSGGDVFVALDQENNLPTLQGVVKWFSPDGTLRQILSGPSRGQASSLNFDAAGNLYVPHWCDNL